MVRASKTSDKTTTETKSRSKAAPKVEAAPAPAPAPEPVVEATEAEPSDPAAFINQRLAEFSAKLQQLTSNLATIKTDFKTLGKDVSRVMKAAVKASSKKRKSNSERKPSGFTKPTRISDEMANFLGVAHGTEMARTAVSKEIHNYVEKHNLKDKDNGRYFRADAKLTKLLNYHYKKGSGDDKKEMLGYFNLQKYMKHHFQKAGDATSA
jgi:chromatin remodeling complex protein RSC6